MWQFFSRNMALLSRPMQLLLHQQMLSVIPGIIQNEKQSDQNMVCGVTAAYVYLPHRYTSVDLSHHDGTADGLHFFTYIWILEVITK